MTDYKTFCNHYALDPDTAEAQRDFQEYRRALATLEALARTASTA